MRQGTRRAERRLDRLEKMLSAAIVFPKAKKAARGKLKLISRTKRGAFLKSVERVKEYVRAGDVFQCVLSQRFDCEPGVSPFEVYRSLRIVNPSPYMYFMRFALEGAGGRVRGPGVRSQERKGREVIWTPAPCTLGPRGSATS